MNALWVDLVKLVGGVGEVKLVPEVLSSIFSLPEFELPLVAPMSFTV